jgi:hypothetical protein
LRCEPGSRAGLGLALPGSATSAAIDRSNSRSPTTAGCSAGRRRGIWGASHLARSQPSRVRRQQSICLSEAAGDCGSRTSLASQPMATRSTRNAPNQRMVRLANGYGHSTRGGILQVADRSAPRAETPARNRNPGKALWAWEFLARRRRRGFFATGRGRRGCVCAARLPSRDVPCPSREVADRSARERFRFASTLVLS